MIKRKTNILFLSIFVLLSWGMRPAIPEEGMYPLSEIHKIDLVKAGLKIDPLDVYNPNDTSLIDALVKIGRCTGSFVSPNGLILTNHHCAFGTISRASTPEKNYLENGFLAKTKQNEIPASGLTVRITESYEDVSEEILSAVKGIDDLTERSQIIKQEMEEIEKKADDKANSIEGSVSEMFKGKTYVLFRYRMIKDVRLVYAPPRSIGEFGGETDNWIWPRHNGDFTFMRAYVAPDGSAATFDKKNIPYSPKKYLKVNPNGVKEGDFTFILGYPGKTYRHNPSYFLEYQENYQLPYISKTYQWMINQLQSIGNEDTGLKLKFASTIKKLANISKNYRGKLKGLKKINLVEQKKIEEKELQKFINENPELEKKYGSLLDQFEAAYYNLFGISEAYLWFKTINKYSNTKVISDYILDYCEDLQKSESQAEKENSSSVKSEIKQNFDIAIKNYNKKFENVYLIKMIEDALKFNGKSKLLSLEDILDGKSPEEYVLKLINNSKISEPQYADELLLKCPEDLTDPVFIFTELLNTDYYRIKSEYDKINGQLTKLSAQLYEIKKQWKKTNFIPDANSTLRLTYGYIKGYSPADAIYMSPVTSLEGVIDKSLLGGEYTIPDKLRILYDTKDFGQFYNDELRSVPVGILYNMDTTGGSSGSPVMNAYGELVGLNFDRAFEATINDFAWDESFSRSIGVDIRYVLWISQKLGGADYLLTEMGVN